MLKNKMPLKKRFVLSYATLVLIPVILLAALFAKTSIHYFKDMVSYTAKLSFQQTSQLIEYYISNVNDLVNSVLGTDSFHEIVEKDNTALSRQEQIKDMLSIRRVFDNCRVKSEVKDVYLYLDNEAIYIGENAQIRELEDIENESWYSYAENSYPGSAIIPGTYLNSNEVVGYAKVIRSSRDYKHTVGILLLQMNKSLLTSYLGDAETAQISIINEKGDVITHNRNWEVQLSVSELAAYGDGEPHIISVNGKSYFLYTRKLEKTDWYLVHLEPYEIMFKMLMTQGMGYLLMFVLILVMGLIFLYLFFRNYLKRVTDMTRHMSRIHEKLPEPMQESDSKDEIDALVTSYNYMLSEMKKMMKEQYELGNQIKEIEMKALYEQINPHFLYNTLTMINWLAEDGQVEDVSSVITALSGFYRLSLNKGKENIYLREELEIAKNFIYIQQMRFGTDIRLECELDPVYEKFVLPKLTLQPLIENALVHGILKRRDKCGTIRVRVNELSGAIQIVIEDDGIGMPPEQVEKMNNGTLQTGGNHYGVWNVVQRASLYYGTNCTLKCSSIEQKGTSVELILPYRAAYNN